MSGIVAFVLTLAGLLALALAVIFRRTHWLGIGVSGLFAAVLMGWYVYVLPFGTGLPFVLGTLGTFGVLSAFFYAVYALEPAVLEELSGVEER